MDQIDIIIMEQERELTKNSQGVAYLTACLNQDPQSAHEIIDEMGCKLTHLLTQWFVLYMMSKEETEGDETSLQAAGEWASWAWRMPRHRHCRLPSAGRSSKSRSRTSRG